MLAIVGRLALVVIVLPLLKRSQGVGLSNSEQARRTQDALVLIERGEQRFHAARGRYTASAADLVALEPRLAEDFATPLQTRIDVSSDGGGYLVQVSGDVLDLVRAHRGTRVTAQ